MNECVLMFVSHCGKKNQKIYNVVQKSRENSKLCSDVLRMRPLCNRGFTTWRLPCAQLLPTLCYNIFAGIEIRHTTFTKDIKYHFHQHCKLVKYKI